MKIGVLGTGYVGLVVGCCLADSGNDVVCADTDQSKVERLRAGDPVIYEPGLREMMTRCVREGRLTFTTSVVDSVKHAEVVFMAVGTPASEDGSTNLSYVLEAAEQIAHAINWPKLVVIKSTVPIGTCQRVKEIIAAKTMHPVEVVSNPEFLSQGRAVRDFMMPNRVIIGTDNEWARNVLGELYAPYLRTGNPIIFMDITSAELAKYVANCMLAARVSLMNDFAVLCDRIGADIEYVRRGISADPRISSKFLFAGVGYGGSCFPKDINALLATARNNDTCLEIMQAVENVNQRQKKYIVDKIVRHFDGSVRDRRVALWGLSFKPNTDDMREAPSVVIVNELLSLGAVVTAYDPVALEGARALFGDRIQHAQSSYEALKDADALIIVTEWNEFRTPDLERMKQEMNSPVIFDGRNILLPDKVRKYGFTYYGVGRP